ncbi:MAG: ABC transporter permease [Tannerella sp.]|jgi:ABC-2 type transport system permease protein|nr:ABC transporter permease [Tannerella sp.]
MPDKRSIIHNVFRVANRETRRLFGRKVYRFCTLGIPSFIVFFFVSLMYKGVPTDLPVAFVDLDNSSLSRNIGRQVNAMEYTRIAGQYVDFESARRAMQQGRVYGIFMIPPHFSQDVAAGRQPKLTIYTNNSFYLPGSLLYKDMSTVANMVSAGVVMQTGQARGATEAQIRAKIQPIVLETHAIANPTMDYEVYLNTVMIPGIISLLIICMTVYCMGIEIKENTREEWFNAGGGSIFVSLTGKMIPHTIVFTVIGLLMYAVFFIFQDFPVNNILAMVANWILYVLASQAMGIFFIGCFPVLRSALCVSVLMAILSFSFAGFSFPVDAMYPVLKAAANIYPLRHYYLIYADQALNAREIVYSLPSYFALAAFLLLPVVIYPRLKWMLKTAKYKP